MEKLHYIGSLLRLGDSQHERRLGTFREYHVLQRVKRRSRFALNDICMTWGCFIAHITRSLGFVERKFYFAHMGYSYDVHQCSHLCSGAWPGKTIVF